MSNPLWPNERIAETLAQFADQDGIVSADDLMLVIYKMRDEMQEKIDQRLTWDQVVIVKRILHAEVDRIRQIIASSDDGRKTQEEFLEDNRYFIHKMEEIKQIIYQWGGENK